MIKKILLTFMSAIVFLWLPVLWLAVDTEPVVNWLEPSNNEKILSVSYDILTDEEKNFQEDLKDIWFRYLGVAKWVLQWVMLIFLVYAWFMFFYWSIWVEEKLEKAKKQIYYSMAWLLFLNVPWVLYSLFWAGDDRQVDSAINSQWFNSWTQDNWNLIITGNFELFIQNNVIWLLEIVIWIIATFSILISAFNIINSDGKDDIITEEKDKIVYSVTALIFVWYIEFFKDAVFTWEQEKVQDVFSSVINLAIFMWWPIALSFIILAWYYLITSNWDEERLTKAKNIVINSIIWVLILMASWTFLADINF